MKSVGLSILMLLSMTVPALALIGIGGFTYDVSLPAGETKDYTDNVSFRGLGLEARWFRSDNTAIGFTWHWSTFHEQGGGTWPVEDGHVTGHNFRRIRCSPVLAVLYFEMGDIEYGARGPLYYAGIGAGVFWIEKRMEIGTGAYQTTRWHFGFAPEAGFMYGVGFNTHVQFGVKFNYALKSGDNTGHSYLTAIIGVSWAR